MVRVAPRIRPRPKQRFRPRAGPFVGMRDSLDPTSSRPNLATLLQNCYPLDPQFGGAVVGRPGFEQIGTQMGASGVRTGQLVYQFTELNGTEHTVLIVGGQFYTYDWATDTITETISAANFTSASITLSTTARCYAVTFADQMIVTDGVNTPWAWDGTSGAGLTKLTNAPVAFGAPAVYYAKLFFVKNTERSTLVWSEENQPNTGYEAGNYNNAWTLGQTDQEPLYRLIGTNEALYAFRARSITAISGAVTPDFSTTGTRDGVSEVVGTTAPASVFHHRGLIFFTDADRRPHVIVPGLGASPIWEDFRETSADFNASQVDKAEGYFDPTTEHAVLAFNEISGSRRSAQLIYHTRDQAPTAAAVFRGYDFDRIGVAKDAAGRPVLVHLDGDGFAYQHGRPDGTIWDDAKATGTEAIEHVVEGPPAGHDLDTEKLWDRLDFTLRMESDLTDVQVRHSTPRGLSAYQEVDLTGFFSLWDVAVFDTDEFSSDSIERHLPIGILGNGRWLSWEIRHAATGERFGLIAGQASGRAAGLFPSTP